MRQSRVTASPSPSPDLKGKYSMHAFPTLTPKGRRQAAGLMLLGAMAAAFALLHALTHTGPLDPSPYNSYTLQALAWRQGRLHLTEDVPRLELAIFEGRYYMSFPPVPTIPLYVLTFFFGENTPDALVVELYAIGAALLLYKALLRRYAPWPAAFLSLLIFLSSSFLPIAFIGGVWYHAQLMAYLFSAAALERMAHQKPTPALLFAALAVGCRPFNALLVLYLLAVFLREGGLNRATLRRLTPGILLGLSVALAMMALNFARFRNPLEFGHNYLPEFSTQGGVQFSLRHIGKNVKTFLWGAPFHALTPFPQFARFGFSMLIGNAGLLLLTLLAPLTALREKSPRPLVPLIFFAMHAFLLLLHRTGGGFQWGARYFADCLIWLFALLIRQKPLSGRALMPLWFVLFVGAELAFWGALTVNIL